MKSPSTQRKDSDKELANILANAVFQDDEGENKEQQIKDDISQVIKEADNVIQNTNLIQKMITMKKKFPPQKALAEPIAPRKSGIPSKKI